MAGLPERTAAGTAVYLVRQKKRQSTAGVLVIADLVLRSRLQRHSSAFLVQDADGVFDLVQEDLAVADLSA